MMDVMKVELVVKLIMNITESYGNCAGIYSYLRVISRIDDGYSPTVFWMLNAAILLITFVLSLFTHCQSSMYRFAEMGNVIGGEEEKCA